MATWEGRPMVITTMGMGEGHHLGHKNCRFWRHANASAHIMLSYPWRMKVRSSFSIIDSSCGWQGVSGIYLELQPYSKEALVVNISGLSGLGARDMTFGSCTAVCSTYHPAYVDKRTGLRVNASKPGRKPKHHTSCLPFVLVQWWMITDDDERFLTMMDDDW